MFEITFRQSVLFMVAWIALLPRATVHSQDNYPLIKEDPEKRVTSIVIPAHEGKISWSDITTLILEAADFKASAIDFPEQMKSSAPIDLESRSGRFTLLAVDLAVGQGLDFKIQRRPCALLVTVNHEILEESMDNAKGIFKKLVLRDKQNWKQQYGLKFEKSISRNSTKVDAPELKNSICVLVHGLNSDSALMNPLERKLEAAGHAVAWFEYPNDGPILGAARLFSRELSAFKTKHPDKNVSIIAHSMGGLVARRMLEDEDLDPENVKRLVMICTPNHGSRFSRGSLGMDLWEHYLTDAKIHEELPRFKAMVADGMNEAARDLHPDSAFLKDLNARSRNSRVQYFNFYGNQGPLPEQALNLIVDSATDFLPSETLADAIRSFKKRKLNEYSEVVSGKGDGVVSIHRARLAGVDRSQKFSVTHRSMWIKPDDPESQRLFQEVLKVVNESEKNPKHDEPALNRSDILNAENLEAGNKPRRVKLRL